LWCKPPAGVDGRLLFAKAEAWSSRLPKSRLQRTPWRRLPTRSCRWESSNCRW